MRTIVISVGISLLTNNKGFLACSEDVINNFQDNQAVVDEIDVKVGNGDRMRVYPDTISGLYDFTEDFIKRYFQDNKIKQNIIDRQNGNDRLPAEISSLYLYYYDKTGSLRDGFNSDLQDRSETDFKKDRVILLTTDTADAVYCANLVREMINGVSLFNTKCCADREVVVIKNLDVYDPSKWAENNDGMETAENSGLKNLYNYFHNLSQGLQGAEKIIIRTGGYKELGANLLMIAIEKGFKSYYLFERSYEFICVDLGGWPDRYSTIATNMHRRG